MAEPASSFEVRSNLREVLADIKQFDPRLARDTRRELRSVGDDAIAEMRGILAQPSQGVVSKTIVKTTRKRADGTFGQLRRRLVGVETAGAKSSQSRGSRKNTAAALKTRVTTGKVRQSIRLTGAGDPFSKSYNLLAWRHPVRFNPDVTTKDRVPWVTQAGRPYFGTVLVRRGEEIRQRAMTVLDGAIEAVEKGKV